MTNVLRPFKSFVVICMIGPFSTFLNSTSTPPENCLLFGICFPFFFVNIWFNKAGVDKRSVIVTSNISLFIVQCLLRMRSHGEC